MVMLYGYIEKPKGSWFSLRETHSMGLPDNEVFIYTVSPIPFVEGMMKDDHIFGTYPVFSQIVSLNPAETIRAQNAKPTVQKIRPLCNRGWANWEKMSTMNVCRHILSSNMGESTTLSCLK